MTPRSMMPANQGDTVKVVGLIFLIVVVFVFAFFRIRGASPQVQPPVEKVALVTTPPPAPVVSDEDTVVLPPPGPLAIDNPFRQVLAKTTGVTPKVVKPVVRPPRRWRPSQVTAYMPPGGLPGVIATRLGGPPVDDIPKLKGIMANGGEGVAVLSVENRDVTVRPGDRLGDGYVVSQVTRRQVVVHKGTVTHVLRIEDR